MPGGSPREQGSWFRPPTQSTRGFVGKDNGYSRVFLLTRVKEYVARGVIDARCMVHESLQRIRIAPLPLFTTRVPGAGASLSTLLAEGSHYVLEFLVILCTLQILRADTHNLMATLPEDLSREVAFQPSPRCPKCTVLYRLTDSNVCTLDCQQPDGCVGALRVPGCRVQNFSGRRG